MSFMIRLMSFYTILYPSNPIDHCTNHRVTKVINGYHIPITNGANPSANYLGKSQLALNSSSWADPDVEHPCFPKVIYKWWENLS